MTYTLTKNQFNELIMTYLREVLYSQRKLLQETDTQNDDYDDSKWLYLVDMLHRKGVGSDLMRLKSMDDMKTRTAVRHLLNTDEIVIKL